MSGERSTTDALPTGGESDTYGARILVSMTPGYDRELLLDALDDRYSVGTVVDVADVTAEFDCCILDETGFRRAFDAGVFDAPSSNDAFLPFVLLLGASSDLADRPSVWDHVDDVVTLPVSKAELTTRIGNLLDHRRSEQRTAERARTIRRQNDRLEEFASIVSHDLRNPLNVAEGHLTGVREESSDEALDEVAWALDRMRRLIEDVLTVAREGETATEPEPVDLRTAVEECWRTVDTDGATRVVETDRTISADRERLDQLLTNLVRNSVEHAGPNVTVTVGDLDDGFYVADDGPGIPESAQSRVFDTGFSTQTDGTGLGLGIVRQMTDAHDWTVSVGTSAEGGARFEITGVERG